MRISEVDRGSKMSAMMPTIATIMDEHVTLEIESIDRLYLNGYIPGLQTPAAVAYFLRHQRDAKFASSMLLDPISKGFSASIDRFVAQRRIPVHRFSKGERKDLETQKRLATFGKNEGVLYLGTAQEKMRTVRTEKRRNPSTGAVFPWLVDATAVVKVYYWYIVDEDFGPLFIKFGGYFPYPMKVCLNGNEYLKRQLTKEDIPFTALDNGVLQCANPKRAQAIAKGLTAKTIRALLFKWLDILPQPLTQADRAAGYQYQFSILQAEFSLTQVFDRPLTGRQFFDQIVRDNLLVGLPSQVSLIFDRRVIKTTPGQFRTRVISDGVIPSLHVDYKSSRIKQYFKEGRALRTETTINDTRDVAIGRSLKNLSQLSVIGFAANRRLLDVQRAVRDGISGEAAFRRIQDPITTSTGTRVAGLRFGDKRVHSLMHALIVLAVLPGVVRARQLRSQLGTQPASVGKCTPGRTTYDLRRLRLHGLIERIPRKLAYRVTDLGLRTALFYVHSYDALVGPGLADILPSIEGSPNAVRQAIEKLQKAMERHADKALQAVA
jgi:hypothetical protein